MVLLKILILNYNDTYFNLVLIDSANAILNEFQTKLRTTYPIDTIYKSALLASNKDIDFFAKNLVYINNSIPFILNNNGVYTQCDPEKFKSKFNITTLDTQQDWIDYISTNNVSTVAFLNNVYDNLKAMDSAIVEVRLANNGFDLHSFNQIFTIEVQPYNSSWISSIVIELSIIILFMSLAYYVNKKVRLS